jgi:hypothetical protein
MRRAPRQLQPERLSSFHPLSTGTIALRSADDIGDGTDVRRYRPFGMKPGNAWLVSFATVMGRTGTSRLYLVLAIVALAGIVFSVTGCGSSSDKTTTSAASDLETWAGGVCTAVTKYRTSLAATRETLRAEDLSRPALQVAVQNASAATRAFTTTLSDLGPPPAPQVDEAKKILQELQSNLRKQADKVRSLSGTNDVKAAASTIKDALAAASADAKQAVDELRKLDPKGNLGQAFDSAGCSSL